MKIIGSITQSEMYAIFKFIVLILLVLPFVPDQVYGPYSVFNPRELVWVIILTSGVGFIGYFLMKYLGSDKGILLTGIIGGLVSSTIVTWVFSKKSKEANELSRNCAVAIFASSTIMVIRVFVWLIVFNPKLLPQLILPLSLILVVQLGVSLFYYKKQLSVSKPQAKFPLGDPINLTQAVIFGIVYTAILFVVSYANSEFGTKGIYISSAISALTDIDAITISMAKLAGHSIDDLTAQNAILLAVLCNTLVKIGITLWVGSKSLKRYVLTGYGLVFLAGLIGFILLNI